MLFLGIFWNILEYFDQKNCVFRRAPLQNKYILALKAPLEKRYGWAVKNNSHKITPKGDPLVDEGVEYLRWASAPSPLNPPLISSHVKLSFVSVSKK